ncbi:MAG: hypothetical protein M1821_001773 [Bathelium mastoideum]|nr:MAG: hypothetical protein M1821_001773 [Bathelium mastoideum]
MSASPAPEQEDQSNRVTFRFCRECSNMLYPREDPNSNNLIFACGMCDHSETADGNNCVWRHELSNTVGETAGITQDVAADPSVGAPAPTATPATLQAFHPYHVSSTSFPTTSHGYEEEDTQEHGNTISFETEYEGDDSMYYNEQDDSNAIDVPAFCSHCGHIIVCPFCHQATPNFPQHEVDWNDPHALGNGGPNRTGRTNEGGPLENGHAQDEDKI